MLQQVRSTTEKTTTMRVYEKDLDLLNKLIEKNDKIKNLADAVRICVEFANAQEVFS